MKLWQKAMPLALLAIGCGLAAQQAFAQGLTDATVKQLATPLVESKTVDGLSVGYILGDKFGVLHLGTANSAKQKPTNKTLYEIGSITKVFTSLLLADAVLRKEIDLQAAAEVANPAGIRLPARDGRAITWLDLSTHRSGLPRLPGNFSPADPLNPYQEYDSKKAAAFLKTFRPTRSAGASQEYSNFGASVLGYLIAQKCGKTYPQLLKSRISDPLKLTDCTIALSSDQKKRLATPHSKFGVATPPWTFADLPGAGGIRATLQDMLRFAKANLNPPQGEVGQMLELAWEQHSDADDSGPATGLGWMISGDGETRWHNGGTGGTSTALFINRPLQCAVIVLANTSVKDQVDQLAIQLIQIAAASSSLKKDESNELAIDAKLRGRLVGRYQLKPNFIFTVTEQDDRLMVGITNQPTQEVFPDSPTRWSYKGVAATLEFKLGKTGSAKSLILHQNGIQQTARRID